MFLGQTGHVQVAGLEWSHCKKGVKKKHFCLKQLFVKTPSGEITALNGHIISNWSINSNRRALKQLDRWKRLHLNAPMRFSNLALCVSINITIQCPLLGVSMFRRLRKPIVQNIWVITLSRLHSELFSIRRKHHNSLKTRRIIGEENDLMYLFLLV